MRPVSQEKRECVISAKKRGESNKAIAMWLDISTQTVRSIIKLHKTTNSISPKPYSDRKSYLSQEDFDKIRETVEKENDITLDELVEKLKLPIKRSRLSVILRSMNFSYKKITAPKGTATRGCREKAQRMERKAKRITFYSRSTINSFISIVSKPNFNIISSERFNSDF